jgi:tRNA (Thr-GGU) A37 N-methylase
MKKYHSPNSIFTHVLVLSLSLAAVGHSNAEKTEAAAEKHGEPKTTIEPTGLPPLSEEIKYMVLTNRTASVEEQVYKIVNSDLTNIQKVQACLLMLPSQKRDGQREFAHAAVKYVTDSTHALVQRPLLEGKLDKQILSVFMTDTLKRPNRIKLPVLLELARAPGHPMQSEARDLLIAFSGKDHGTNWAEWQQTLQTLLASSPN